MTEESPKSLVGRRVYVEALKELAIIVEDAEEKGLYRIVRDWEGTFVYRKDFSVFEKEEEKECPLDLNT